MPEAKPMGHFIALEGGEGTGKSTQCKLLADRLRKAGLRVLETREPGGTAGAETIRLLLKSGALENHGPEVETMLISAARADHVEQVIRPALEAGQWVICDRFTDSTRVYQGTGSGVSARFIETLEQVSTDGILPDLVVVLDAPAETGMQRARARALQQGGGGDRFERESLSYHRKLRTAFRELVKQQPGRRVLINAELEPGEVERQIWQQVAAKFGLAPDREKQLEQGNGGTPVKN